MHYLRLLPWLFCGFIAVSGFLPEPWLARVEFNHTAITQGQLWRIITGQWVHFGVNHSLMNGLCLALVQFQLLSILPLRSWLWMQAVIQLAVGIGLLLASDVEIYRGYSGAFCGVLAVGLLLNISRDGWLLVAVYVGLLIKILLEQAPDYNIHYLQDLIGVAVAIDAHLYGFVSGSLLAALWLLKRSLGAAEKPGQRNTG